MSEMNASEAYMAGLKLGLEAVPQEYFVIRYKEAPKSISSVVEVFTLKELVGIRLAELAKLGVCGLRIWRAADAGVEADLKERLAPCRT